MQTVCGYAVELDTRPSQTFVPSPLKFSELERIKIDAEIQRLIQCGIVEPVQNSATDEFLSNIFARPKKDGRVRIILNLKQFNNYMQHIHFKMETLKSAVNLMTQDCFLASVDIADAFYSIPIRKQDRKYFRFIYDGQKYQFTALVMGLATAPRVFTKILKPVFATLRAKGHISTIYIDDSCLQGQTYQSCLQNIDDTVSLLDSLGLTINTDKSKLVPSQSIEFVGFVLCSRTMTVRLTQQKILQILAQCKEVIQMTSITITEFAQLIGKFVAAEPGVEYAPLFYKPLEKVKTAALKQKHGNFNSFMSITPNIRNEIRWWLDNLQSSFKHISHGNPSVTIHTDASLTGYGACIQGQNLTTNGVWSVDEQRLHINVLELKACHFALLALCPDLRDQHIRIYSDNTTCCAYINKFGGKSPELDRISRDIWFWCIARRIHLTAAHVAGTANIEADRLSRVFNDDLEWSLDESVFRNIETAFGILEIDMFASRLNKKLSHYVSRFPEPLAWAIDAFSLDWGNKLLYMFPPFSLIARVLQKVHQDRAEAVLVAPIWTTQGWWAQLMHLLCQQSYYLPPSQGILSLPHKPDQKHPLKKMVLGVFRLSGKPCASKEYRSKLPLSYSVDGELPHRNSTQATSNDGYSFVIDNRSVQLNRL